MSKFCTPSQAVNHISSNQRVFLHGGAATPEVLVRALVAQSRRLRNVELIHLHTSGQAAYARPEYEKSFRVANLFVGHNMRRELDGDRVDYLPLFLSEIPQLFRSGRRPLDVALVQVSHQTGGATAAWVFRWTWRAPPSIPRASSSRDGATLQMGIGAVPAENPSLRSPVGPKRGCLASSRPYDPTPGS